MSSLRLPRVGDTEAYRGALLLSFALAGAAFFATGVITAPYGRHLRAGWGPTIPRRLAWIVMETPSVVLFAWLFARGPHADDLAPRVLAAYWLVHYVQRAWLDPFVLQTRGGRMPIVLMLCAIAYNTLNSYLNATWLGTLGANYSWRWLIDIRFLYGTLLFCAGFVINRWADIVLRRLRRRGDAGGTRYAIPRGGLYEDISCPNYFGELVQWTGWAIATWSQAGLSFAIFSAANLIPRAVAHHRWYRRTFPDYPRRRRAIIPGVL